MADLTKKINLVVNVIHDGKTTTVRTTVDRDAATAAIDINLDSPIPFNK